MPFVLILAFAASLGLHAAVLFGPDIDLPTENEPSPLQAELRPMPKALRDAPIAEPVRTPLRKGRRTVRHETPPATPVMTVPDAAGQASAAVPADEAVAAPERPSVNEAVPAPPTEVLPPPDMPDFGRIRYRVDRGDSGFEIGRAVSEWEVAEGHYTLRLHTETTGIVWLFKRYRIDMESRGRLTAEGLQPERFVIRRNGADGGETADFDWAQRTLRVGNGEPQTLETGAQDLLSFNFHLGFMPDPRIARALTIATGRKVGIYRLEAIGDEELELPLGRVRTLHLRAPGSNTTELWLAYDYLLLPVKIRHEDNTGGSLVQVATDIQLGSVGGDGPQR
ncbi:DUF3108 domain-containing protein [Propionivibrio dicarboxylicus]|uniref:Outer membrane lipoprotein-sorting protein n=1 Tax=Propionivibrio dicarboxylicus TaxID=83767 RepID=A0A1G8HK49_9RHOO|nr:DUF3108 domain-containing protein [Propionivibrio dicarboxylicus]SDI06810.1 Protein of unknown function [Propionivibrio dicarboxylicus]